MNMISAASDLMIVQRVDVWWLFDTTPKMNGIKVDKNTSTSSRKKKTCYFLSLSHETSKDPNQSHVIIEADKFLLTALSPKKGMVDSMTAGEIIIPT